MKLLIRDNERKGKRAQVNLARLARLLVRREEGGIKDYEKYTEKTYEYGINTKEYRGQSSR